MTQPIAYAKAGLVYLDTGGRYEPTTDWDAHVRQYDCRFQPQLASTIQAARKEAERQRRENENE